MSLFGVSDASSMAMMKRPAQQKGAVNPKMFMVKGLKSGPTLGG